MRTCNQVEHGLRSGVEHIMGKGRIAHGFHVRDSSRRKCMTSKIQCIGRYRQTRTIIESLRGNTYVGCRKLPRDPLAGRGLVSLNFTNTHKGERLEGNLRVKLDKNLGLLSRPLIPIRLLNVIIRNNNDCLWCRGHRVQETSKVTPRLNLLTNVRRTGNRITHGQDEFPFGLHATNVRDYTIFAIFKYLHGAGVSTNRGAKIEIGQAVIRVSSADVDVPSVMGGVGAATVKAS